MKKMMLVFLAVVAACLMGCGPSPAGPGTTPGDTGTTPGDTGSPTTTFLNAHWFVARGAPVNTDGVDGDLYLDTESTILYVKTAGAWVAVGTLRGDGGAAGTAGANGSGWLFGTGAPAASLGSNGDLYLDTVSTIAYKKVNGAWAELFSLQGGSGTPGVDGDDGATWITGIGAPSADIGRVGDLYLDVQSVIVYEKATGGWGELVSLRPPEAAQYIFTPFIPVSIWGVASSGERFVAVGEGGTVMTSTNGADWNAEQSSIFGRMAPGTSQTGKGGSPLAMRRRAASRGLVTGDENYDSDIPFYGIAYGGPAGSEVFVAVREPSGVGTNDVVLYSDDGSYDTWNYADLGMTGVYILNAITYAGGQFIAMGRDDYVGSYCIIKSEDGVNWDLTPAFSGSPPYSPLAGCAFDPSFEVGGEVVGKYVAVGWWNGNIFESTDSGSTWSVPVGLSLPGNLLSEGPTFGLNGVAYANGKFVAVGQGEDLNFGGNKPIPLILISTDGVTWTYPELPLGGSYSLYGVAAGGAGFVAVGYGYVPVWAQGLLQYPPVADYWTTETRSVVLTSANGVSWSIQRWEEPLSCVAWGQIGDQGFYAIARGEGLSGRF